MSNCGAWLPGYQALLAKDARAIGQGCAVPTVFFFDRVSRGAWISPLSEVAVL